MTSPTSLEDRLTRLENQLDRVLALLERQGSGGILSGAANQAADALANIYGDAEVKERVGELVLRLGEPETLEALTRIGVLLPRLEYALQFAAGGPELLEEGLDVVREQMARQGTDAAEVQLRVQAGVDALGALSRPGTLRALTRLTQGAAKSAPVMEALGAATETIAAVEGQDALRHRLTETLVLLVQEETLDSLGRIAALTPQIEYAVNALAAGPEMLEEGLELVRERLAEQGSDSADLQRRVAAGADALAALSDVKTLRALGALGTAAPALAPFVEAAARAGSQLAKYEGQAQLTERLAESILRITEAETLDALTRVASLTPQVEYALNALAAGPEMLEEALDMIRSRAAESGHTVHDLNRRAAASAEALLALSEPKVLETLTGLLPLLPPLRGTLTQLADRAGRIDLEPLVMLGEAAVDPEVTRALTELVKLAPNLAPALASLPIQPRTLAILRNLNQAVESAATQPAQVGLFGAMRSMSNPKVQRALGFLLTVAEQLGEHLEQAPKQLGSGR